MNTGTIAQDHQEAQSAAEQSGFLRAGVLACFDYFLVTHPRTISIEVPSTLAPMRTNPNFDLYQIGEMHQECELGLP